jgi:hypothetical protein
MLVMKYTFLSCEVAFQKFCFSESYVSSHGRVYLETGAVLLMGIKVESPVFLYEFSQNGN